LAFFSLLLATNDAVLFIEMFLIWFINLTSSFLLDCEIFDIIAVNLEFSHSELLEQWTDGGRKTSALSDWIFQKINSALNPSKTQQIKKQISNYNYS